MKKNYIKELDRKERSPSVGREWIVIAVRRYGSKLTASPSMRREWIEIMCGFGIHIEKRRLPPCGGSGLKC